MRRLPSRSEQIALLYRTDFASFVGFAFRELHPGQALRKAWSIDLIADRVEAVAKGDRKRLVINAPPRSLKSLIATISLASFVLGRRPDRRILLIFGHDALATDMMMRLRRLMLSARYGSLFPKVQLQATQTTITTQFGGQIRSAIVGRPLSGHGADLIIIDDPLSPTYAQDDAIREKVNHWYDQEVRQRLNNKVDATTSPRRCRQAGQTSRGSKTLPHRDTRIGKYRCAFVRAERARVHPHSAGDSSKRQASSPGNSGQENWPERKARKPRPTDGDSGP